MSNNPAIKFLLLFVLFMAIIFGLWSLPFFETFLIDPLAKLNASWSERFLSIFGWESWSRERNLGIGEGSGVYIDAGCLAIEPSAIFLSSVLAFPGLWNKKLVGVVGGIIFLLLLNLLRVIGLVLIQEYYPAWFDFFHYEFFQALFLILAVVLWFVWIRWSRKKPQAKVAG